MNDPAEKAVNVFYYIRAYAINGVGPAYAYHKSFTTLPLVPALQLSHIIVKDITLF